MFKKINDFTWFFVSFLKCFWWNFMKITTNSCSIQNCPKITFTICILTVISNSQNFVKFFDFWVKTINWRCDSEEKFHHFFNFAWKTLIFLKIHNNFNFHQWRYLIFTASANFWFFFWNYKFAINQKEWYDKNDWRNNWVLYFLIFLSISMAGGQRK